MTFRNTKSRAYTHQNSYPGSKRRRRRQYVPPPRCWKGRLEFKGLDHTTGFAFVFKGFDHEKQTHVDIKVENMDVKNAHRTIKKEWRLLSKLHNSGCHVPVPIHCGRVQSRRFLVMSKCGPALSEYWTSCGKQFSLQTVISLMIELLQIIESLHSVGIIHRDIKLQNIKTSIHDPTVLFLWDFSLSDFYQEPYSKKHIRMTENNPRYGTLRYASINCHDGIEQSRRDDLETLGYSIIYSMDGSLPWGSVVEKDTRRKWMKVGEIKKGCSVERLCNGFPDCFFQYFKYVRSLDFDSAPDYATLRNLFSDTYNSHSFERNFRFDWEPLME